MIRKIIVIDEEKCTGCGLCVDACHEGAIGMIDGKAKLLRDDYCDGLGDCIPACPADAITFEEREALAYDEALVLANQGKKIMPPLPCGCPSTHSKRIERKPANEEAYAVKIESELLQWPIQIKLVPVLASYFNHADLLIAADCTAFAYGNFHREFMKDKITIIACPKLDGINYADKLTDIISSNDINSITVTRMQVPCCGGIEQAVREALLNSGKAISVEVVTISTDGKII